MITLQTKHNLAVESPDYMFPKGTKNSKGGVNYNWSNGFNPFVDEVIEYFGTSDLNVLDVGAASGYLVHDFLLKGCNAVGLEGSDWPIKNSVENWNIHYNSRLFTCDIGQPFSILEDGVQMKFDLINAWEVIEHLHPDNLKTFSDNIYSHLSDDGVFVFSISPWFESSDVDASVNLHLSHEIKFKHQWEDIFDSFKFVGPITEKHDSGYHYMFKNRYRGKVRGAEGHKHTFWSTLQKK